MMKVCGSSSDGNLGPLAAGGQEACSGWDERELGGAVPWTTDYQRKKMGAMSSPGVGSASWMWSWWGLGAVTFVETVEEKRVVIRAGRESPSFYCCRKLAVSNKLTRFHARCWQGWALHGMQIFAISSLLYVARR